MLSSVNDFCFNLFPKEKFCTTSKELKCYPVQIEKVDRIIRMNRTPNENIKAKYFKCGVLCLQDTGNHMLLLNI